MNAADEPTAVHDSIVKSAGSAGPNFKFATTYQALCSCGWEGRPRSDADDAEHDAQQHRDAS